MAAAAPDTLYIYAGLSSLDINVPFISSIVRHEPGMPAAWAFKLMQLDT